MRRAVALVLAIPFTGSCDPSAREPGDTDRVTITSNWVFHLENGMTTTEPTLTGTFAAYQWTADEFAGPLIAMPVEGNQGRYTIDGIAPDEEYYLSIPEVLGTVRPSEAYLVSRARSLDVSTDAWGRRDWTPSVDGTRVVVDLTGMTPWQAGDTLAVMVPNVFDFYLETTDGLEEGATDVSELAFDWGDHPLVYSSSGDSLHVQHLKRPFVSGAGFVQVIADDFVEFLDQVNGVSTRVSGTFSPVQPTETLLVGWPASAFKSAVGVSDGPRYNSGFASLSIDPGGLGDLPIVRADVNVDEEGSIGPVEFGNPFPETMEPTRRSRSLARIPPLVRGDQRDGPLHALSVASCSEPRLRHCSADSASRSLWLPGRSNCVGQWSAGHGDKLRRTGPRIMAPPWPGGSTDPVSVERTFHRGAGHRCRTVHTTCQWGGDGAGLAPGTILVQTSMTTRSRMHRANGSLVKGPRQATWMAAWNATRRPTATRCRRSRRVDGRSG